MSEIKQAYSKRNGIVFYSNDCPGMAVEAYIENGEIKTQIVPKGFLNFIERFGVYYNEPNNVTFKFNPKIVVFYDIMLIAISIFTMDFNLIFASFYFSFTTSFDLFIFLNIIYILKFGKEKSVGRYHAAEHMAINAYNTLHRIPTVEEVKKFSRFSKNCGSERNIRNIIIFSSLSILFAINISKFSFWLILLYPILFILMILDMKYSILRFLQILVTNKPTDLEIKVAIKGIEELEKFEKDFKEKFQTIPFPTFFIF